MESDLKGKHLFTLQFYRFEYDKKMSELSCADDDHPLKPSEPSSTASHVVEHLEGRLIKFIENDSS